MHDYSRRLYTRPGALCHTGSRTLTHSTIHLVVAKRKASAVYLFGWTFSFFHFTLPHPGMHLPRPQPLMEKQQNTFFHQPQPLILILSPMLLVEVGLGLGHLFDTMS